MEKCLDLAIPGVLRYRIEIVLSILEIEKNVIRELAKELKTGSAQADVKRLIGRLILEQSSRIAVVVPEPDLIQERQLQVVAAIAVQFIAQFFDFLFLGWFGYRIGRCVLCMEITHR